LHLCRLAGPNRSAPPPRLGSSPGWLCLTLPRFLVQVCTFGELHHYQMHATLSSLPHPTASEASSTLLARLHLCKSAHLQKCRPQARTRSAPLPRLISAGWLCLTLPRFLVQVCTSDELHHIDQMQATLSFLPHPTASEASSTLLAKLRLQICTSARMRARGPEQTSTAAEAVISAGMAMPHISRPSRCLTSLCSSASMQSCTPGKLHN
jgi:hypothetical protein